MSKIPQIALIVETSRGYGRQVSLGVARYAHLHGPWSVYLVPGESQAMSFPDAKYWNGDGIITRLETRRLEEDVLRANLPTIALDMSDEQANPGNPLSRFTDLQVDSLEAGRLAAEHLLERNYASFAFVGFGQEVWSERRCKGFQSRLRKSGHEVAVYEARDKKWEKERARLAEWLDSLPKPVGVMAANDIRGREVLDACGLADLHVPEDVGVIGVDNDELLCELSFPSLSSVSLNAVVGGYQAAKRLDALIQGRKFKHHKIVVQALSVVTRHSTSSSSIQDRKVVEAQEMIRRAKGRGLSVTDVAAGVNIGRRELDARFVASLERTVASEIQRARFEHAKRLLEETDYPIPHVAELAGYSSDSYMVQVFRKRLNQTPAKYRANLRYVTAQAFLSESAIIRAR